MAYSHNKNGELRDYQKEKVYKWERDCILSQDHSNVPFDTIQSIVDYVWEEYGLKYPPTVTALNPLDQAGGRGSRNRIRFHRDGTRTCIILHEIAHSMASIIDENGNSIGNMHGPKFVGIYMQLVHKFLKINGLIMMHRAEVHGVDYDINAKPFFLDD